MSYSRSYHETITVHGSESKTVSYPKSESGGSMTVTVHYTEHVPVDIDIHVDTNPFDRSVGRANKNVNLLTGSVVATEAAHIAAKVKSSEAISDSIIDVFFGLIKSEINQQLTEIKPRVEALLVEMVQHQQSCVAKQKQLESDFGRIAERYSKIFFDLDKELRNRILMLNQSAVGVHATLTTRVHHSFSDISSGVATIYNKEGNNLQAILFASGLKSKALSLIESSKNYLFSEKNLAAQLQQILIPVEAKTATKKQIPVLYFEAKNASNANDVQIVSPKETPTLKSNEKKLKDSFSNVASKWKTLDTKNREHINTFLKLQLSGENQTINPRVAEQIMQLWKQDTNIQTNA
ncbi:MAG: hypothetical protein E6Q89_08945 [Bacteroidia bacterium]|nr:MAG: hypothetical protein E6Q89_08945 [Bacteroidia bacterium]